MFLGIASDSQALTFPCGLCRPSVHNPAHMGKRARSAATTAAAASESSAGARSTVTTAAAASESSAGARSTATTATTAAASESSAGSRSTATTAASSAASGRHLAAGARSSGSQSRAKAKAAAAKARGGPLHMLLGRNVPCHRCRKETLIEASVLASVVVCTVCLAAWSPRQSWKVPNLLIDSGRPIVIINISLSLCIDRQ